MTSYWNANFKFGRGHIHDSGYILYFASTGRLQFNPSDKFFNNFLIAEFIALRSFIYLYVSILYHSKVILECLFQ